MKKKNLSLIFSIAIIALVAQLSLFMTVVPSIFSNNNSQASVSSSDSTTSDVSDDSEEDLQDTETLDDVVIDNTNIDPEYEEYVHYENSGDDEEEEKLVESVVSGEFDGHTVTVSGLMPEGTTIKLSDVDNNSVDKLMTEMGQDNSVFACDIKLIDAEGKEWQPAENGVDVSISGFEIEDENKLEFYHIAEDIDTVLDSGSIDDYVGNIDKVSLTRDGEASFETFGFSTYIGFTVDFHYNGSTFSIAGMSDVLLSEIFTQLQIQKDATKVTSLKFSDDSLISVERQENGDWLLTSLEAFSTTESLTMTFEDGEVIEMVVTDAVDKTNFKGVQPGGELYGTITVTGAVYLQNPIVVPTGKRLEIVCSNVATSHNFWKYDNFAGPMIKVESGGALRIDGSAAPSSNPLTFYGRQKQGTDNSTDITIPDALIRFINGTNVYGGTTYKFGYCIMNDVVMKDINAKGDSGAAIQINGKLNEVNITKCEFDNITSADSGAAIKIASNTNMVITMTDGYTSGGKPGQIYLSDNTFTSCTSKSGMGGAISINGKVASATTINKCTFTTCKAERGGAIRFNGTTGAETTISSCSFNSCKATSTDIDARVGGAVYVHNDTGSHNGFMIKGTTFESCNAHRGGVIYLSGNCVVNNNFEVSSDCTLSNCEAVCNDTCAAKHSDGNATVYENTDGGAIYLAKDAQIKSSFIVGKVKFLDCKAGRNGGAIFVNSIIKNFVISPVDNTSWTSFENCTAGLNGGGICFYDSSNITNVYINKHASTDIGGNGKVTNNDIGNYTDSSQKNSVVRFIGCKADRGGGAMVFRGKIGTTCKIFKTLIDSCESTNGSALLLEGDDAKIKSMEIKDTVVRNCISKKVVKDTQYGGTIRTTGPVSCVLTLNNCMVYNNTTWHYGGGLYWNAAGSTDTKVTITGCTFDSNNACNMGGGIYCESDMEINNTVVKNNTSGADGGGIAQTVYNNIKTSWKANETNLTLGTGVKVYDNTAAKNGGGIALVLRYSENVQASDRSDILTNGFTFSFTMDDVATDAIVYGNTAGVYGGGVYYGTGTTTGINDGPYSNAPTPKSEIPERKQAFLETNNVSAEEKQGIVDLYTKKINIKAGSIYSNIAGTDGGGIYANGKSVTINVSKGEIYSNSAGTRDKTFIRYKHHSENDLTTEMEKVTITLSPNDVVGQGGGICIKGDSAECIFKGGNVGSGTPNESDNGGGVAAEKATIYIDCENNNGSIVPAGSTSNIINNIAQINGGGLYVTQGGKIVMHGGSVYGNSADADGGGAYVTGADDTGKKSSIEIHGGNIGDNVANNGGGICCVQNATAKMTGGNIQSNKVTYKGGGVYLDSATFEMSSGNISSNAATYFATDNNVENSYGGGVYIEDSTFSLTGGDITNNTAAYIGGGLYSDNSTAVIGGNISNNGSLIVDGKTINTTYGGGAFIAKSSTLTLTGSITGNTASDSAGGIGLDTATLKMTNGNITYNNAKYGGGIFASKKSTISVTGTTSSTDGVTYGNVSYNTAQKGGGIYVKNCNVKLENATLEYNKATNGPGGAIYAIEGGTVTVSEGFIRYNEAQGTNTSTTAYGIKDFTGIGGGVCIADGASEENRTTFTLSDDTSDDNIVNIGIYSNKASFAADDVYASGNNTDLNVPNKSEMNLAGYNGNAKGWYEDYPNSDTSYNSGIGMDSLNEGSRYRNEIQYHSRKHIFEDVNKATAGETSFVNNVDTYVAMTLGVSTNGTLTVSKTIVDKTGKNFDGMDDTEFTFRILKDDNTQLTDNEINNIKYTLSDGIEYPLNENGDFVLKGGQIAEFVNLNGTYVVAEIIDNKPYASYVVSTSYALNSGTYTDALITPSFEVTDGNAVDVAFTNTLKSVDITFKFYDRNMTEDEKPADIASTPTTYTKTFIGKEYQKYIDEYDKKTAGENTTEFSSMINYTGVEVGAKYKNVVDEYYLWDTQAKAINGIAGMSVPNRDYVNNSVIYHTDRYGRPQGTEGCEAKDSEKWVTYYCGDTASDFENNACNVSDVTSVNVWLYNTPKTYSVNIYAANTGSILEEGLDGKYVAVDRTYSNNNVYYNQRLGGALDSSIDAATNHLTAYDIPAYLGEYINTSPVVDDVEVGALKFSYWSFDREGKKVASTETFYNNRITNDLELYAVYEVNPSKKPGATISMNATDKIIGSDGLERTRLNTMLNPYNCPNYDSNIERVSVIYIVSSTGESVDVAQFREVIKQSLIANEGKSSFTIKDSETSQVYYVYVNPVLSNKNRVQFTGSFKTASLAGKSVSAFAAMYYNGTGLDNVTYNNWIVSDNCAEYKFNADGACSSAMLR